MMWFWIIVAVALIILGLFIFSQGGQNLGPAICTFGVMILLILLVGPARSEEAHGHTHAGALGRFYQSWMMPDSPKTSCCSDQDCEPSASRIVNGEWQAERDGEWVSIPSYKVEQDRDSPDGRSHLCGRKSFSGSFSVFCFIRGAGG